MAPAPLAIALKVNHARHLQVARRGGLCTNFDIWFQRLGQVGLLLNLICALIAGALLGFDRKVRHREIGGRTDLPVSLGAAGFSILTLEFSAMFAESDISSDPTRIVQGLIGAFGFLGAGIIIQGDERVGGLATAANLWVAGTVGRASGLGIYIHAMAIALIAGGIPAMNRFMSNRGSNDRPDNCLNAPVSARSVSAALCGQLGLASAWPPGCINQFWLSIDYGYVVATAEQICQIWPWTVQPRHSTPLNLVLSHSRKQAIADREAPPAISFSRKQYKPRYPYSNARCGFTFSKLL